ncbi:transcriptional regulator [Campylobacter sp. 19-13652]|uniref:helix-turn-helix transcriptional regulator n=1 Tax=Campylobacter sp. 19-13652 TaxID=2840180 RepID=UPI001C751E46|nr:PAS domain-containing protein [Campylobacter sp. 19-13652]BCX78783.1 DNA-binding protein [Campylobacter sp. 19-13652]
MNEFLKNSYINMVDFLAAVLGENYEIVLHEISEQNSSVIAIKNSHISGRDIGAPLTDFALNILKNEEFKHSEYALNYKALAKGKRINGSTFFIKENGTITGMLCINYDDEGAKDVLERLAKILGLNCSFDETKSVSQETLSASVEEMIGSLVGDKVELVNSGAILTPAQKEEAIQILYQNSIFSVKSAVNIASKMLKISEPTIYRYLKNIKN